MSNPRRFDDAEIREILELAARHEQGETRQLPTTARGLTAAELQEIGQEVGLDPEAVARAVAEVEGRGRTVPRKATLGMPTEVGRTVPLPRAPTDQEWEILVSEMRSTFGGKGEATTEGSLRAWSDGNLHAMIEPTGTGYRLRLIDSNQAELGALGTGGFLLAFSLMLLLVILAKGKTELAVVVPGFIALMGAAGIGRTVMVLPRWAREREEQMERIGTRAAALLARDVEDVEPTDTPDG